MAGSSPAQRSHDAHEVEHHGHSREPVVVNGVSSDDEPSVEWGWHAHYPRLAEAAGFLTAGGLLIMLYGNHSGLTEDLFLIGLALAFLALSIGSIVKRKRSWQQR